MSASSVDVPPPTGLVKPQRSWQGKFARDTVAGTCGGIAVVAIGHPFDTLKVRLQTQSMTNPLYSKLLVSEPPTLSLLLRLANSRQTHLRINPDWRLVKLWQQTAQRLKFLK